MAIRAVGSYVLLVAVEAGRWRIEVRDVRTGRSWTFDSFEGLGAHLERVARVGPP